MTSVDYVRTVVGVLGTASRYDRAHALALDVDGTAYVDARPGQWLNAQFAWLDLHDRARDSGADYALLIEDDAVVPDGVRFARPPEKGLVSLYLGRSYPRFWQRPIERAVAEADKTGASWIRATRLLHAVAVAIPTDWIAPLVTPPRRACHANLGVDELLSYRNAGRPVWYAYPSPVDHDDTAPTTVPHIGPRDLPRVAWRHGRPRWSDRYVSM